MPEMPEAHDDFSLIKECLSGKQAAWDTFVERFSKLIYYAINKTLRSYNASFQEDDIADIYNSTFLQFLENDYKKLRQFKGTHNCSLSSWVRLITIRRTIDYLRSQRTFVSVEESGESESFLENLEDGQGTALDQIEAEEAKGMLQDAIVGLPSSDRLFMELYYERELSPEEIAVVMNVSVNAIYSKKNRLREKLKRSLGSLV